MLQHYALNEFYADRLSHRLVMAKKWWDRILFLTFAAVFIAAWLGLFFRKEQTGTLMDQYGGMFSQCIRLAQTDHLLTIPD